MIEKLLNNLVLNTITAAKYISTSNFSPKKTSAIAINAFPKKPVKNIVRLTF